MSTDKIDFKKLEKIRYYVRDFFINGYKDKNIYKEEGSISNSTFANRTKTIGFILDDIFDSDDIYRLMFDQSSVSDNPFHNILKYKSFPESSMQRYFVIMSALNANKAHGITAYDIQSYLDGLDPDFEEKDQHSIIATDIKKLLSRGIVRKSKTRYYINETQKLETLLVQASFQNMLEFYRETSQFSVIGSYIQDKLMCDGAIRTRQRIFKYKDRFITQTLDSIIKLELVEALKNQKLIKITDDQSNTFDCKPLKFFISCKTGREYLFYYDTENNNCKSIRLDKISQTAKSNKMSLVDTSNVSDKIYWSVPYINTELCEHIECTIVIDKTESYIYDIIMSEKRNAMIFDEGNGLVKFRVDTNDIKNTLFFLKSFTGRISEFECSNIEEKKRFINDINETLALYGE